MFDDYETEIGIGDILPASTATSARGMTRVNNASGTGPLPPATQTPASESDQPLGLAVVVVPTPDLGNCSLLTNRASLGTLLWPESLLATY